MNKKFNQIDDYNVFYYCIFYMFFIVLYVYILLQIYNYFDFYSNNNSG